MSAGTRIPESDHLRSVRRDSAPPRRTEHSRTEKPQAEKSQSDKPAAGGKTRPAGTGTAANATANTDTSGKTLTKPAKGAGATVPAGRGNATSFINAPKVNSSPQEPVLENLVKSSGESTTARELFRQMARALSLPTDTLSITLLALCRFFSLSPNQALMLRRELLALPRLMSRTSASRTSSPKAAKEKASLEAKAFAATAALDKGVTLSPEALEHYAGFLGPPGLTEEGETGEDNAFSGGGRENLPGRPAEPGRPQNAGQVFLLEEAPTAEELRAIAEGEAKKDGLLNFLNAIPGKNRQYWTVFPFKLSKRGTEIEVFLRILKGEPFFAGENGHIIIDITGPKRQYRCFLKKMAGKLRADIRVYPELSPGNLKALKKKADRFLGEGTGLAGNSLGFGEILVQNGETAASWVVDWCTECLPSVNKEV